MPELFAGWNEVRLPVCQPGDGGTPHHVDEPGLWEIGCPRGESDHISRIPGGSHGQFRPTRFPIYGGFRVPWVEQEADETVDEYLTALRISGDGLRIRRPGGEEPEAPVGGGMLQQEDTAGTFVGDETAHVGTGAGRHAGERNGP